MRCQRAYFEEAYEMLLEAGLTFLKKSKCRKLMIEIPEEKIRFILAKPMDARLCGTWREGSWHSRKDTLLEQHRTVHELLI